METKDLILLMAMPIILISLVFYFDKNPTITAAVTSQQEQSSILGTYSIDPSFKSKLNFDLFSDYKNFKENLNTVIEGCKNSDDIGQCLIDKSNELNWVCTEKNEAISILKDFVDKFNECLNLADDGVVCRFSLDNWNILDRIFNIKLTSEDQRIKVELIEGNTVLETAYINQEDILYTGYNNKDSLGKSADVINIVVKYLAKKPIILDASAKSVSDGSTIRLSMRFLLYKGNGEVKFIDFNEENSFRLPKPGNIIIDLPRTKGIKFCANTGKKIYAFDRSDNTAKLRDVVYKFAVTYPNPETPPPIKSLVAEDKLKAENSIVLKWQKVMKDDGTEVSDLDHYNIYCSTNPLQDPDSKEIKLDTLQQTMAVKSDINYDIWQVDISKCGNDNIKDGNVYHFAVTAVTKSKKESKAIVDATTKSVDDLAPGTQKIILVNSNGIRQEGTSMACLDLPLSDSNKIGSLQVRFFAPEKDEDEITKIGTDEPLAYNLQFSRQTPQTENLNDCSNSKKCVQLTSATQDLETTQEIPKRTFNKFTEIDDVLSSTFVEGQTYCFTIVAKDKNNNVLKTLSLPYKFEKPQQWKNLELHPVMKGYFDNNGQIIYSQ